MYTCFFSIYFCCSFSSGGCILCHCRELLQFPSPCTCFALPSQTADQNAESIWVRVAFWKYFPVHFIKVFCFDIECNTYILFIAVYTRKAYWAQPFTFHRTGLVVDFVACSFTHCTVQKLMNGCFDFTAVHEASDG